MANQKELFGVRCHFLTTYQQWRRRLNAGQERDEGSLDGVDGAELEEVRNVEN